MRSRSRAGIRQPLTKPGSQRVQISGWNRPRSRSSERVIGVDIESCRVCSGTVRLIACIGGWLRIHTILDCPKSTDETCELLPLRENRVLPELELVH